jgi:hypothetical protein
MKKEQLIELGLTEEQITEVFKLNGLAVNAAKAEVETKDTELASLKEQLGLANQQIESFKDLDVEGIKKAAEEYKTKFEETKLQSQKEIENLKFEHMLESKLINAGAKDVKVAKAILNIEELRSSNNQETDIETAITKAKETHSYVYKDSDPVGTGGSMGNTGKSKLLTITKEDFNKMSYKEKVDLYNKQPELYKKLNE